MKTLLAAALVAGGPLAVAVPPAAAADCGRLPAVVQGDPQVKPGQAAAAYLYHGTHGWSLRVTHPSKQRMVVTGTLRASAGISHYRTVRLERGDAVAESRDGRTLSFRVSNYGGLDGFDFQAECSTRLTVSLAVNGAQASTTQVHLGKGRAHPTSVPFVVERH